MQNDHRDLGQPSTKLPRGILCSMPIDAPLQDQGKPQRVLGLFSVTCIVIGAIIGVGIFFTPSSVARLCPTPALALGAWAVAGLIALCGALVFAELGGMYNRNGAQYEILRDTYGPLPAFLFGFCLATIIEPGSIAVMSLICAENLLIACGSQGAVSRFTLILMAASLILVLACTNAIGVRRGAMVQNISVIAKIIALLAIVAIGLWYSKTGAPRELTGSTPPSSATLSPMTALLAALVPAMFSYGGWQQSLWNAGEVRNPRSSIPRAIVIGVLLVIAIYMLVNWAYIHLLGIEGVAGSNSLAADAVGTAFPGRGRRIAAAAVALSAFGVLNAQFLTAPWLVLGMARDRRFFPLFGQLNSRFGTPINAIAILAAISLAMLGISGAVNELVNAVVQVDAVFFALTGLALLILRRTRRNADRPFRVPLAFIIAMIFVLGELGAVIGGYLDPAVRFSAIYAAAWLAIGFIVYFIWFAERS
jgi:APA family basic amino acid/polyamine antiporter